MTKNKIFEDHEIQKSITLTLSSTKRENMILGLVEHTQFICSPTNISFDMSHNERHAKILKTLLNTQITNPTVRENLALIISKIHLFNMGCISVGWRDSSRESHACRLEKTMDAATLVLPYSLGLYTLLTALALPDEFETGQTLPDLCELSIVQHDLDQFSDLDESEQPNPNPYAITISANATSISIDMHRDNSPRMEVVLEIDNNMPRIMPYAGMRQAPIALIETSMKETRLRLNADHSPESRYLTIPYINGNGTGTADGQEEEWSGVKTN